MSDSANASAIISMCSHLCVGENVKPLEPGEWSKLAAALHGQNLEPKDLLRFSSSDFEARFNFDSVQAQRLCRLIDRGGSIAFEVEKYKKMGIEIVTRADENYPKRLKQKLKNQCPPLFYYTGELSLFDERLVGFVGSRDVNQADIVFTQKTIDKVISHGFGVVSGGAGGIDSISRESTLKSGGIVAECLSDSLVKKVKDKEIIRAIKSGKFVAISVAKPNAGFNVGIAMMRNRYIYAGSIGTVVVKAECGKGGTWNGATENLKNDWCPTFCWENASYEGNVALIEKGAISIDENWDANISSYKHPERGVHLQTSLFEESPQPSVF